MKCDTDKAQKLRELTEYYEQHRDYHIKATSRRAGGLVNAEDVVQEAFARAVQYISSYDQGQKMQKWFNSILVNCLRDFMREERNQGMVKQAQDPEYVDIEDAININEKAEEIMQVVSELRYPAKEIVRRFLVLGYSAKEIARSMDVSRRAVNQALFRFYQKVRQQV